jgi:hypothetical protein
LTLLRKIINIELQILFKEVKNSFKSWKYRAAYFIFLVTLISIYFGLDLFFSFIQLEQYLIELFLKNEINNFQTIFFLWILYSVFKGYQYNDLIKIFNIADETLLYPSSIKSNHIYLSKFIKNMVIHAIFLFIFFITINPIFSYLNLNISDFLIFFISSLILLEINYLVNYTIKFLQINKNNKQIFIILIIIIFFYAFSHLFDFSTIILIAPISVLYQILMNSNDYYILFISIISMFVMFLSLLYYSYINAVNYYENVSYNKKTITYGSTDLSLTKIIENINSLEFQLFQKDYTIIQRLNGKKLISDIILNYSLVYILIINLNNDILRSLIFKDMIFYISPFVLILLINIRSNFLSKLYDEWNSLWFLKTSSVSIDKIINSKIIFSYVYNFIFNHPFLIFLFIYLGYNGFYIFIIIFSVILLDVYLKLFLSYYFNSKINIFVNDFLKSFIHILLEFLLIGLNLLLYVTNIEYMYIYTVFLFSLIITKYDVPIKYYILELIVNNYFVGMISIIFISISMISLRMMEANNSTFILYKMIWFIITILASSLFLRKIMSNIIKERMIKTDI